MRVGAVHPFALIADAQKLLNRRLLDPVSYGDQRNVQFLHGIGNKAPSLDEISSGASQMIAPYRACPRKSVNWFGSIDDLVQPKNIKGNSPGLEQRDHGLKLTTPGYEKAPRILPLLRNNQQDAVGLYLSGAVGVNRE